MEVVGALSVAVELADYEAGRGPRMQRGFVQRFLECSGAQEVNIGPRTLAVV